MTRESRWTDIDRDPPEEAPLPRVRILRDAEHAICGDRNSAYGEPTQDFVRTAALWTDWFKSYLVEGAEFTAHDVAVFMILLKLSRIAWAPDRRDSWLDIAGYSACGYECVENP